LRVDLVLDQQHYNFIPAPTGNKVKRAYVQQVVITPPDYLAEQRS
jgi:hypothetical protein